MNVIAVPAYITRCLDRHIYQSELNLIRQGKIDVIAFSSTAEVAGFLNTIDDKQDYHNCLVACFGPYTAANAKQLGMNVSIVAKNYSSFAGFADAIADFFSN